MSKMKKFLLNSQQKSSVKASAEEALQKLESTERAAEQKLQDSLLIVNESKVHTEAWGADETPNDEDDVMLGYRGTSINTTFAHASVGALGGSHFLISEEDIKKSSKTTKKWGEAKQSEHVTVPVAVEKPPEPKKSTESSLSNLVENMRQDRPIAISQTRTVVSTTNKNYSRYFPSFEDAVSVETVKSAIPNDTNKSVAAKSANVKGTGELAQTKLDTDALSTQNLASNQKSKEHLAFVQKSELDLEAPTYNDVQKVLNEIVDYLQQAREKYFPSFEPVKIDYSEEQTKKKYVGRSKNNTEKFMVKV